MNVNNSLVSVIIPCYNYGNYLPFTLDNILNQSFNNWECIVVDDGSKDNTGKIARQYADRDKRFKYVYQQNKGLSAARNTGIENSSGKYIQLLDADDLIHQTKLEQQVSFMETNPQVDIIYGDASFFHTNSPEVFHTARDEEKDKTEKLKGSGKGHDMVKRFCVNNVMPVSSPLIRKSVFDKVGTFDITYRSYEDWQFWFRCAVKGMFFQYAPFKGTETYIRYGHVSMMTNSRKMTENGIRIRKFMMPLLPLDLKLYNIYRLMKLQAKMALLKKKNG